MVPKYTHICIYNLQSSSETSRQNKKKKLGYYKSVHIIASFVRIHLNANSCNSKSQSFVFVQDGSKWFCSLDNFNSLPRGYSFGFWLLLALKLTIRILIGRGDAVGGGSKNFVKLIMCALC